MEKKVDQEQGAPASKRQRTGDGPATTDAGGGDVAVDTQPNGAQQNQQKQKGQGDGGPKKRGGQRDLRIPTIQQAVKVNNLKYAMKLFGEVQAEGSLTLPTPVVNALMFLACGGDQWERYVRGLTPLTAAEAAAAAAAAGSVEEAEAGGAGEAEGGEGGRQQQQQPHKQQQWRGKHPRPDVPLPEGPPPSREELVAAVELLWDYMRSSKLQPDQATYLALSRLEALRGNPQASLQWAMECGKKGRPVQLRLFHPAQVCYCLSADVGALHRIDGLISARNLDCTEYEYARLLEGMAAAAAAEQAPEQAQESYEQLKAVLLRMQSDLNELAPATADYIAKFFERAPHAGDPAAASGTTAAAGDSGRRWQVLRDVPVAADGTCEAAGGQLRVIDLEDKDWEAFASAIAELARKNMGTKSADFDTFVQWYDRNGPYDVFVDAANVAFFGQNFEGGGFNWRQVQDMYDMLKQKFEGKKILVMVHRKRTVDPEARAPGVQAFLEKLRHTKNFYSTPPGANDDWFWLYACVRSKHAGLLISNDELRDHIFSLLRPKHFLKWKERHIAHYSYSHANGAVPGAGPPGGAARGPTPPPVSGPGRFALQLPHPYTACVQQLPESGAWMVPVSGGAWMCVKQERE